MKRVSVIPFLIILSLGAAAQPQAGEIESLKKQIAASRQDTTRITLTNQLAYNYVYSKADSSLLLAQQALRMSVAAKYKKGEAEALTIKGQVYEGIGNYPKALSLLLESLKISEQINDAYQTERNLHVISNVYSDEGDELQSIKYALVAKSIAEAANLQRGLTIDLLNLGDSYEKLGVLDSALYYEKSALERTRIAKDDELYFTVQNNLGNIYLKMGQVDTAIAYYRRALIYQKQSQYYDIYCETTLGLAKIFSKKGQQDSAVYYAKQSITAGWLGGFTLSVLKASQFLTDYFKSKGHIDSAFYYQTILLTAKDSLYSQEKTNTFQNLSFAEYQRQRDIQEQKAASQVQVRLYLLIAVITFLAILAVVLWRNSTKRRQANTLLQHQKEEIQHALSDLKVAQEQLVQSAKMSSLGELTAGIAHEIQNPLNFVNNFSEVNIELLEELKAATIKTGAERSAQAEQELINDIIANEQKIKHHGKRAESIVKGMLEHSKSETGVKEPAEINKLADECLRLAYHGLRAKHKNFNATLVTNFDEQLPKINVVPQDIGRVLLNLFNNAFYAVNHKAQNSGDGYKPEVCVTTYTENGQLVIKVKDNGTGIPAAVKDKIMQPFFTTKPTGQGTGLGLSLAYDMIVKRHGGSMHVESVEAEGAEFTIQLPMA